MSLVITFASLGPSFGGASPDTLGIQQGKGASNTFREDVDLSINHYGYDDNDSESLLVTIIDSTEKVFDLHVCDGDNLEEIDQQIACARKQMEWVDKN